jgi:hypothetical protein
MQDGLASIPHASLPSATSLHLVPASLIPHTPALAPVTTFNSSWVGGGMSGGWGSGPSRPLHPPNPIRPWD